MATNGSSNRIQSDKKYPKLSKAASDYLEIDFFKKADLYAGYSCYKCTYFIKGNHCAIIEDCGPDIRELESRTVAPNGVCTLWHPNEMETR
jgi:hypothetical protein